MQVILLERIGRLGQMGEVVNVKDGYARNFLLPKAKALRATKSNIAYFETQKQQLEARNLDLKKDAEKVLKTLEGMSVSVIRQASDGGQLYGSVTSKDVSDLVNAKGVTISKDMVRIDRSFKMLGLYPMTIILHPEVKTEITLNIARSEDEAIIQLEKGTALVSDDVDNLAEAAIKAVEADEKKEEAVAEEKAEAEAKTEE